MAFQIDTTIPELLVSSLPIDLVTSIEDGLPVGAQRAYASARGMEEGHLPTVVGHLRHFHMNETFHRALAVNQANPSPLCGNKVVVGRAGIFSLARFNIHEGYWTNYRRSLTRKQLSEANRSIEPLVQPELFSSYTPATKATVFFVAVFAGSLRVSPEAPTSIQIAVPDSQMKSWLLREPISSFLERYSHVQDLQRDLAVPRLKRIADQQQGNDGKGK
ncbi:hypothetical protein [Acidicapsa acidisoli]|uniref:hypothetical protein n=1 Tax=Acidicapsa acidisoli TaxID=1615681 RepID=UPI0021DFE060|nr:hypothetical protein [Acidicapsa acidisoli]